MSKIVWVSGLVVLVLWSLGMWGVAVLLTGSGDFLAAQAAAWSYVYPEAELVVSTASAWLAHFGTAALWFVWVTGALLVLFVTWLTVQLAELVGKALGKAAPHTARIADAVRQRLQPGPPIEKQS